jgi:phosphatidylserine/phosphatidylglycerophosphate/cardiolipin synthase-like enzyme
VRNIGRAETRIIIAAPFITRAPGSLLAGSIAARRRQRPKLSAALLTAVTKNSVRGGVLSIEALRAFHRAGVTIRSIPTLHAKAICIDRRWALVTAATSRSPG